MASVITSIYNAIAAWTPTVNGKSIKCRNIAQVKNQFAEGDHPTRMMLVTTGDTETGSAPFVAIGKAQHIVWYIEDRLYFRPIGAGQGLQDYNAELIEYAASYLEQYRQNRAPTAQSHCTDLRIVPAIVNWPDVEGGTPYAGVRCILTVEEYVTGA